MCVWLVLYHIFIPFCSYWKKKLIGYQSIKKLQISNSGLLFWLLPLNNRNSNLVLTWCFLCPLDYWYTDHGNHPAFWWKLTNRWNLNARHTHTYVVSLAYFLCPHIIPIYYSHGGHTFYNEMMSLTNMTGLFGNFVCIQNCCWHFQDGVGSSAHLCASGQ